MTQTVTHQEGSTAALEQGIRQRIEQLSYLPTTVAVAMKFMELGKDPEAEPADYAKVISSDSALSSKLLSLANSSWFGVRNKITKPHLAVNLLGLGTVRTLAISYCLTGLHNELRLSPDESRMFWAASLCKASAARQFVGRKDPKLGEEAFAAGLFQDFAVPIMFASARQQFGPVVADAAIANRARLEKERALFRLDHAEVGRMVSQKLDLPDVFVDAIAFHHNHASLREFLSVPAMADGLYIASLFPHVLDAWNHEDAEELRRFLSEQAGLGPEQTTEFLQAVQKEFEGVYRYFESGEQPGISLPDLLEAACREVADNTTRLVGTMHELLQQAASAGHEVHQLLSKQSRLEEAATHDPLTGALNREGFTVRARECLAKGCRYSAPIALAYMDIDCFKRLNDACGHSAGDRALKQVVALIKQSIRRGDSVGRLGGDEFAVILEDCPAEEAQRVVERITAAIAQEPVARGGAARQVTVSVGLVWGTVQGAEALDDLLARADELMYKAKRAGGNRVRTARLASAARAIA